MNVIIWMGQHTIYQKQKQFTLWPVSDALYTYEKIALLWIG